MGPLLGARTADRAERFHRRRGDHFWRLLFPPRCLTCGVLLPPASAVPLCRPCTAIFTPAGRICPCCGQLPAPGRACACPVEDQPLQGLFALSWYEGRWRQMLHRFKFQGKRALARPLGGWLGMRFREQGGWQPDLVAPMPLHRHRQQARGYNQAQLLARFTAEALQLPLASLLERRKVTLAQSGLSHRRRLENIRDAFVCRRAPPPGSRILLVDDIYSTGATMHEAAGVLWREGLIVHGAVAAFTPRLG